MVEVEVVEAAMVAVVDRSSSSSSTQEAVEAATAKSRMRRSRSTGKSSNSISSNPCRRRLLRRRRSCSGHSVVAPVLAVMHISITLQTVEHISSIRSRSCKNVGKVMTALTTRCTRWTESYFVSGKHCKRAQNLPVAVWGVWRFPFLCLVGLA